MSDTHALLEVLQADVYAVLKNTPALVNANVIADNEGDIEAKVAKALSTLTPTNNKNGLAVVVLLPEITEGEKNLPGPPLTVKVEIRVLENVLLNRAAATGTLLRSSQAALDVLSTLQLRHLGHCLIYSDKDPISPVDVKKGHVSHAVTLFTRYHGLITDKPLMPTVTEDGDSLILACATPDTLIYYTSDGTFPTRESELYASPLYLVAVGTTLRVAAYTAAPPFTMPPSDVLEFTILATPPGEVNLLDGLISHWKLDEHLSSIVSFICFGETFTQHSPELWLSSSYSFIYDVAGYWTFEGNSSNPISSEVAPCDADWGSVGTLFITNYDSNEVFHGDVAGWSSQNNYSIVPDGVWQFFDDVPNFIDSSETLTAYPWEGIWSGTTFTFFGFESIVYSIGVREDSHTNAYHLTDNNAVGQTTGVIGNAADFNGSNYLSTTGTPLGAVATAVSISAWMKPATSSQWREFIGAWGGSPRYLLGVEGNIAKAGIITEIGESFAHSGIDICTIGSWYHVVMTFDGSVGGGTLSIYVDGELATATTGCGSTIADSAQLFFIGNQGWNEPCVGVVDSVSEWSRAITAGEVAALHNSGAGLDYENF